MVDTAKTQPVSLRDELANSYDEQASTVIEPDPETPEPEAAEPGEPGAEAAAEPENEEPAAEDETTAQQRDKAGKFAKKDGEGEDKDKNKAAQPASLDAPSNWSAEDRANYAKLPKEGKEFLLRRHKQMEADYTKKTQELAVQSKDIAASKNFKDNVEHLFTPYRNYFATQGMDEVGGVRYLLGWFHSLQQNPEQTIVHLAQQYGVQSLTPKQGQQVNPELAPVLQRLHQVETQFAQDRQAQQNAIVSSSLAQVDSFAQETDAEGNPKYPHFETVRGDMAVFIQNGRAANLEEAYGLAIRLHPEIFDKQFEASILGTQKTTQQQELSEAAKKAAQAKKAAKGIKSGSANVEKNAAKSLRDDISEAYDQQAAS
jgi:hypothetical protein